MGALIPTIFAQGAEATETLSASGGGEFFLFWILGPLALASALAVVLIKRPVHAALFLVVNFFCVAVFYFALGGQFLGTMQITVYAGAVVILFLFVIMLLGIEAEGVGLDWKQSRHIAAALGSGAVFLGLAGWVLNPWMSLASACNTNEAVVEAAKANPSVACKGLSLDQGQVLHDLGVGLFTNYVWPFEVMAVLLTVAAVGALIIGRFNEKPSDLVEFGEAVAPGEALPQAGIEQYDDVDDEDDLAFDDTVVHSVSETEEGA
ncbi:NADH-quinone oxidoreductase subunit J [Stomatohabitans albus]|uniref:NADH-quinone oxidoreductase subunit J n=1 Tax=Stomatohabitans albus TaxID=3110766 RepID=UPI00300C6BA5